MDKSKGFTLIELMIVVLIVGVITGVIGFVLLGTVDAWTLKFNRNDLLWDGRLAMNRMLREIREVKDLTSITTASSSEFRFTNTGDADITYSLSGTDLNRTADGTGNTLAEDVSSLSFTYYDSAGDTVSTPVVSPGETDIRRVKINLTLEKNGETFYLQSASIPRNLQ